ncbi:hypothetical protein EDD11_005986 [Mortierella claussenii]|nr:hypothetical protein EDD11_005986 [Mortierella claussenii]
MANKEPSSSSKQDPPEVAEFQKELHNLFDSRTASASKIDRLTKLALKSARYYKNIVYCLEKFITRCVPEYKLTGLYVLDSICRSSQSIKSKSSSSSFTGAEYVSRFEKNIEALFAEFCKVQEDKEKEKVKRVVEIWERSGTFSARTVENIKKKYFPLLSTIKAENSKSSAPSASPATESNSSAEQSVTAAMATDPASLISSLAASFGQTSSHVNSPATSTPISSTSSTSTPSYLPISTMTGTELTASHAPPVYPQYAGQPNHTEQAPAPSNPLLASISDPSSALALQTLLATVSQVKAAAAAVSSTPVPAPIPAAVAQVPLLQSSMSDLPPVLQQLQGALMNSNQNGAFLPNNNTMVSSTVASPYLHADAQQRGGFNDKSQSNGVGAASSSGLRDPRVDPRLGQAQGQGQGHAQSHAQPQPTQPSSIQAPMFGGASVGQRVSSSTILSSDPRGQLGQGFDSSSMAQLASFLNAGRNGPPLMTVVPPHESSGSATSLSLPPSTHHHSVPLPPRPRPEAGQISGDDHQPPHRGPPSHPSLPNRPRIGQELYTQRSHDTNSGLQTHHIPVDRSQPTMSRIPIIVADDPSAGPDHIRVISRTLWVGGTFVPTISEPDLEAIFAVKGKIATLMVNRAKFNAFIKMADRAQAERCKAELDRTAVQGEVMKVGWGCGFGPRDCFDYTAGSSLIPLDRLTDTDRRWLSNSVVGGFGTNEPIRGGVVILEPNIEPVGPDGREALPKRGAGAGRGGRGGGAAGGGAGAGGERGRGRGRGHLTMDHLEFASGVGRGRGASMTGGDGRGANMTGSGGRGRGMDEHSGEQHQQHLAHPLPNRPSVGMGSGSGPSWQIGKRDSGRGADQDSKVNDMNFSAGLSYPQQQQQQKEHGQEEETRRPKKSRWE